MQWPKRKKQEKRIEINDMKMLYIYMEDVWSDTQRRDQERTHQRTNESDAGFQNDHGEMIELVRAYDEER